MTDEQKDQKEESSDTKVLEDKQKEDLSADLSGEVSTETEASAKAEQKPQENKNQTQEQPVDQKPDTNKVMPDKPAEGESKPDKKPAEPEKPSSSQRGSLRAAKAMEGKPAEAQKSAVEVPKPEVPTSESGSPRRDVGVGKKPAAPAKPKPEPSGKFKDLIKDIESLKVTELAELVKELENRFGVSASPMAIGAAPAAGAPAGEEGAAAEEKTQFTVVLADSGTQKINVIKAIREINPDLGLKEAKDIADAPPKEIKKDVNKEEAEAAKKKLEEAGAKVELK